MTSYDTLYDFFISVTKVSDLDLPSTDEGKYDLIKVAVLSYNNRFRTDITLDDTEEELSIDLTNDQLIITSLYMRLTSLRNIYSYKMAFYAPQTKELGLKFINGQLNAAKENIKEGKDAIDEAVFYADESSPN